MLRVPHCSTLLLVMFSPHLYALVSFDLRVLLCASSQRVARRHTELSKPAGLYRDWEETGIWTPRTTAVRENVPLSFSYWHLNAVHSTKTLNQSVSTCISTMPMLLIWPAWKGPSRLTGYLCRLLEDTLAKTVTQNLKSVKLEKRESSNNLPTLKGHLE